MNISPISFGQNFVSTFKAYNNQKGQVEDLKIAEYDYSFYDVAHIGRNAQRWTNSIEKRDDLAASKIYLNSYMAGDESKKFIGIEDEEGRIQKLLVADLGRKYSIVGANIYKRNTMSGLSDK